MLGAKLGVSDYLSRVCEEIQRLDPAQIEKVSELIEAAYDEGRFVFIIGNGGSGANASHLCEDLAKCTLRDFENQKRLKVLSLTDNTAGIMAWANDEGYDRIFVEQLKNLASPGDLLLAISGSGNSPNILKAVSWANEHGLTTVGITGFLGRQAQDPGPLQPARGRSTTWGSSNRCTRSSSTGSSTTSTAVSPPRQPSPTGSEPADRMAEPWVLGIEIGGTKLQLGIGQGQGSLAALERLRVDPSRGAAGILRADPGRVRHVCSRKPNLDQRADRGRRHRLRRTGRRRAGTHPKILPDRRLGRFPAGRLDWRASRGSAGRPGKRRRYRRAGGSPLRRGRRLFAAPLYDRRQRNRRRPDRRSSGSIAGSGTGAVEIGHLRVPDVTSSGARTARARASGLRLGDRLGRPRTSLAG